MVVPVLVPEGPCIVAGCPLNLAPLMKFLHPIIQSFFFFFLCLSSTYQPIAYQLGDKETEVLCLAKGKMHNI